MARRYIGIDVHAKSCTIAVLSAMGKRLREWQVETARETLLEAVKSVAGERYICFEEGTLSEWLYEVLEPVAKEIDVIVPPKRRGVKSDSVDARAAAEAMRVQSREVRRVYKAPRTFTALRKAVRTHWQVQRDVVRVKNRLNTCYRARGLSGLDSGIYDRERRDAWLKKLGPVQRRQAEHFSIELDALRPVLQQAEAWLAEEGKKVKVVELLATAPGIGMIRASQIAAVVLSPHRFRTRSQFWMYCGLGIVTRASSEWVMAGPAWQREQVQQTRGLNKQRNPLLKNVFKGAAQTVRRLSDHPLQLAYQRALAGGVKPNLATLTLARRIAAAVLAMWKNNKEYDATKQQPRT